MSLQNVTVQANQAWQSTGITIPAQTSFVIHYVSGTWTADPNTNGGQLYDANGCSSVIVPADQTTYPITGVNMGALVGRISGGTPFLIGDGPYSIWLMNAGELELCINDDLTGKYGAGLTDNSGSVVMQVASNSIPDFSQPLAQDPAQSYPGTPLAQLGVLQNLIGTWTNQNLPGTTVGGPQSPFSYNVMPLPQMKGQPGSPFGYILKNFTYYEEMTFTAIHGNAPNRAGDNQQICYTLFYEQRVYFAEGPNTNALVHAENGSLLVIANTAQPLGPYGNGDNEGLGNQTVPAPDPIPQTQYNLVKQVAVPHGNSILALGKYSGQVSAGLPEIPPVSPIPAIIDTHQYNVTDPVTNPQPDLTANPNLALINALNAPPNKCTHFITLDLSSANGAGTVANISFEQKASNVQQYDFTYWLESYDGGITFPQLQYSQTIILQFNIGGTLYNFPHVTVNTLTKVS